MKFLKKGTAVLIVIMVMLMLTLTLSSCSLFGQEVPSENASANSNQENYSWINEMHSLYGYNQLDEKLRKAYDDIVQAWLTLDESITTEKIDGDDLSDITNNILHDYPIITWIDKQYSYKNIIIGTKINFKYTIDKAALDEYISEINDKADELVQDIAPATSDFDKSVAVHDRLVKLIEYNRDAESQDQVYGAIINNQAACQGYAKAYQLLMLKLGVETIVVFGESTEPHAWNMVQLDDEYYFVDVTFDDRVLSDGGGYLSHEYMLLNDSQSSKTHTPSGNGAKFKLPKCDSIKYNYFVRNNMIVSAENINEFSEQLKSLAKQAIEKRLGEFQIKVENSSLAKQIEEEHFATGLADSAIGVAVSKYRGVEYRGRTFDEISNIYTFILEYK